jgi:hypothetical protein
MANQKTFNNAKKTNQTKTLNNSSSLVLNQNIIHPKQIGCIQLPDATLNKSLRQPNLQVFRSIEPCMEKDCKMQPPLPLFFLRMQYLFYISINFMGEPSSYNTFFSVSPRVNNHY